MPAKHCACGAPIVHTGSRYECQGRSFCEIRSTGRETVWLNTSLEDMPFTAIQKGDFVQLEEGWREVVDRQDRELVFGRGRTRKFYSEVEGLGLGYMVRRPVC
ncbi:hypothetical protein PP504_gp36 [Gordonia phage Dolores]|uniref:Uncharacterized protein n=2 Tax=Beenievirus TaxID=3044673 RepID=A0AAE9BM19_9CAUD|nr:hypothetical protein PP504_gp36 [Gordonia phage Dolores]YP_010654508.1 hypothetical protein PP508_gp35 [Gordonia phage Samman98]QYC54514.1 hypothetical protein SEA_SAMMAN98_35 [Gordonia phage Samman98]UAJ16467.1 hypothetical protein SEA_DOLORES_36 [Gordonia phage Dolores]URM87936.1 hypothetical protein SEA_WINKNICK_37 [Gordonia phage WinkNick]